MTNTPPANGHYADINGLNLYYEITGTGSPLVLLHGAFGTTSTFAEMVPLLAQNYQVITVDLQGHGRTGDIDRPLTREHMADDVAALIRHLGFEQADVMGYSMGGGVALQTAIRHPEQVRKLIVISAAIKQSGWYPEMVEGLKQMGAGFAEAMKPTPLYQLYSSIAPKPENWVELCVKMGEQTRKDFDWSKEVAALKMPVLIVIGDADGMDPGHAVEIFELLGGGKRDGSWDGSGMSNSRLAILPATTHYNIFSSPTLVSSVLPFLDAPMPAAK